MGKRGSCLWVSWLRKLRGDEGVLSPSSLEVGVGLIYTKT